MDVPVIRAADGQPVGGHGGRGGWHGQKRSAIIGLLSESLPAIAGFGVASARPGDLSAGCRAPQLMAPPCCGAAFVVFVQGGAMIQGDTMVSVD
jgi:hypothetical protein